MAWGIPVGSDLHCRASGRMRRECVQVVGCELRAKLSETMPNLGQNLGTRGNLSTSLDKCWTTSGVTFRGVQRAIVPHCPGNFILSAQNGLYRDGNISSRAHVIMCKRILVHMHAQTCLRSSGLFVPCVCFVCSPVRVCFPRFVLSYLFLFISLLFFSHLNLCFLLFVSFVASSFFLDEARSYLS